MNKVGAPLGGRVHWFLLNLPRSLSHVYEIKYNYDYHNYSLLRYRKRTLVDMFIIIRTSRRCWRCMYYNALYTYHEYFSAQSSKALIAGIEKLYKKIRSSEKREKG